MKHVFSLKSLFALVCGVAAVQTFAAPQKTWDAIYNAIFFQRPLLICPVNLQHKIFALAASVTTISWHILFQKLLTINFN